MSDPYSRMHRAVLAALAACDPLGLADPAIRLEEEYDAEAREIARRALGASADTGALESLIQEVFVQQFKTRISDADLAKIVRVVASC